MSWLTTPVLVLVVLVELLTCELQRAAQRALSRSQQGQTGVFGVRVLQTLHQRDGRVLHKLHQQLGGARDGDKTDNRDMKRVTYSKYEGVKMKRLPLVWSQAHQKASVSLC